MWLSKISYPLFSTGLAQESRKMFQHDYKNVDWDVKHKLRQTNLSFHIFFTPGHMHTYSKTCLKRPLKNRQNMVLRTNGSLMKVKSIAECCLGAFCNTFDLH